MNPFISKIRTYCEFIKISHTLFAFPFCLIAAVQAMRETGFSWKKTAWIVLAFAAARAFAMAQNRIVDRDFDAQNPRTADRHLPTGAITLTDAKRFAAGSAMIFIAVTTRLNTLCVILSPLVLAYLAFYSYTKRFTEWSHLVLGGALGLAPLAAETAVRGSVSWPTAVLGISVIFWVAGFDIFYACQDVDFDRSAGLFSLPARLGPQGALQAAVGFHATAFILFVLYGTLARLGWIYFSAQGVILLLLIYEQVLVRRNKIEAAFFQLNGLLALLQLGAVLLDPLSRSA